MAFTLPDKGEAANDLQSVMFQEYLDIMIAGIAGTECVNSGCAVTASSGFTLAISAGSVISANVVRTVASGTINLSAADATYPRLDFVFIDSAGTKSVRTGTAATNPKPPTRSAGDVILAVVYVPAADTVIASNQITDLRVTSPRLAPWPVGSIFEAVVATNPADASMLGGGTWVAFGEGRVVVGLDTGQTEFDTVEETGGAKTHTLSTAEIPSHTHISEYVNSPATYHAGDFKIVRDAATDVTSDTWTARTSGAAGSGSAHNNLQPYITAYRWKRTA